MQDLNRRSSDYVQSTFSLDNIAASYLSVANAGAYGVGAIWSELTGTQDLPSFYLGLWFISSVLLLFSNRYITIELGFKYSLTLATWQAFIITILTRASGIQMHLMGHKSTLPWNAYFKSIIPIGMSFAIATIGTAVASNHLPLMVAQLIPCTAPLLTEYLRVRLSIKNGETRQWWKIAFTSLFLASASAGGLKFGAFDTELTNREKYGIHYTDAKTQTYTHFGVALCLLLFGVLAEAISSVYMERSLRPGNGKIPITELLYHVIPISTLFLGFASSILEPGASKELLKLAAPVLISNGLFGLAVFTTIPLVIQHTSSTTLSLAGGLKNVFCTFLACIIYSIGVGYLHALGFFFALIGFSKFLKQEVDGHSNTQDGRLGYHTVDGITPEGDFGAPESKTSTKLREDDIDLHISFDNDKIRPPKSSYNLFSIVIILIILVVVTATDRVPHSTYLYTDQPEYRTRINRTKIATIIEPRNLPHLGPLILHFLSVLPPDWPMTVWCSTENVEVLKHTPALLRHVNDGRLNLTLLPHTAVDIHNGEYLSRFLTRPWFWQQFGQAEWMLFFQSDSILCSRSEQSIEDWVGFDWVGAPWNDNKVSLGGNGGLSMRKISSMAYITQNMKREDNGRAEDVYFSESLATLPGTKWPIKHQGYFSLEEQHAAMKEWAWAPFGMHSGGRYRTANLWRDQSRIAKLMEWCPELNIFYTSVSTISPFSSQADKQKDEDRRKEEDAKRKEEDRKKKEAEDKKKNKDTGGKKKDDNVVVVVVVEQAKSPEQKKKEEAEKKKKDEEAKKKNENVVVVVVVEEAGAAEKKKKKEAEEAARKKKKPSR